MKRNNCYVITGSVGVGKTTLINYLCKQYKKFYKVPEIAAELIEEQMTIGGHLIPWIDRYAFEEELLKRKIEAFLIAPENKICLFDRGIPEAIAFFKLENKYVPQKYYEAAEEYRYNDKIFILPPWKEIYENRPTRPQKWEEALKLHKLIIEVYRDIGYYLVEVPKTSLEKRAQFIIKEIGDILWER